MLLQIRTVIADALRIDDEVNGFLKYCDNHGKIVKKNNTERVHGT